MFIAASVTPANASRQTPARLTGRMASNNRSPLQLSCSFFANTMSIANSSRLRDGGLEDALDRRIQQGVVLSVGLLGRQPFDQRARKTRDDSVIPSQAPVAFVPRIATRQGNDPHDLGMLDEFGVEVVPLRQGDLEHDQLTWG